MSISLGSAILDLAANVSRLQADLGKAASEVERFANRANRVLSTVGAVVSVGAFTAFIKSSIDAMDAMKDLGARTGLVGDQLLALKAAADKSGSSLEGIDKLFSKLPKQLNEAAQGAGDAGKAFEKLGVNPKAGLTDLYGFLEDVGRGFAQFEDGADKSALAIQALGKGGDKFIPVLEALGEAAERMKKLGITVDQSSIESADKFNDTLVDMKMLSEQTGRQLAQGLLPALQDIADVWIEMNRRGETFVTVGQLIGTALKELGAFALVTATAFREVYRDLEALVRVGMAAAKLNFFGEGGVADIVGKRAEQFRSATAAMDAATARLVGTPPTPTGKAALYTDEAYGNTTLRRRRAGVTETSAGADKADALAKAREAYLDQLTKNAIEAEKMLGQQRESILQRFHAQGLISERDYADSRLAIVSDAYVAESKLIDEQIGRAQAEAKTKAAGSKEYFDAMKKLAEAQGQRNKLDEDFKAKSLNIYLDSIDGARRYADSVAEVRDRLAELEGRSGAAAAGRFDRQYRELANAARANGDTGALDDLNRLRAYEQAAANIADIKERSAIVNQDLSSSEERIQNALKMGSINDLDAMTRTGAARQAAVAQLRELADAYEAVARASGNPKMISDAAAMRAQFEKLAAEADVLGQKLRGIGEDNLATAIADVANGTKSIADSFKNMARSILRELNDMASKIISRSIMRSLFPDLYGGGGGGGSGLLSNIFGSLLGGGSGLGYGTAGSAAATAMVPGPGGAMVPALAGGGPVQAGRAYVVGDGGRPEVFVPGMNGRVLPSVDDYVGARGVTINMTVNATDAASFQRSESQINAMLARSARLGRRNL